MTEVYAKILTCVVIRLWHVSMTKTTLLRAQAVALARARAWRASTQRARMARRAQRDMKAFRARAAHAPGHATMAVVVC